MAVLGGLSCAKEIIDNRNGLVQQLACMVASIHLAGENDGSGVRPTEAQRDAFLKASNELAKIAADIQSHVGGGQ